MLLSELHDMIPPPVYWQTHGDVHLGMFTIGDTQYTLQFIKVEKNNPIAQAIPGQKITKNTYFFAFAAIINGQPVDTDTNKGDSVALFSTITQELVKFVHQHGVDCLYFGCSVNRPKLKRIYERIIRKYSSAYAWETTNVSTINYMGDTKFVWVVSKSKE